MAATTLQRCVLRNMSLFRHLSTPSCSAFAVPTTANNCDRRPRITVGSTRLCKSNCVTYRYCLSRRYASDKSTETEPVPIKLSLYQRFKQMYRDYWYVLVPVHLVTSTIWFGSFYYMAKSGVDIIGVFESLGASEKITNHLKDSSMGYLAISYALYKIVTPLRYTVTLGGTTISINYLTKFGYIKPVPSPTKLKQMFDERKDNIMDSMREKKQELINRADQLKGGNIMNAMKEKKDFIEKTKENIENQLNKQEKVIDNIGISKCKKK